MKRADTQLTLSDDRPEEKGLVQRTRSCTDRRIVAIALTDKGRQVVDSMIAVATEVLTSAFSLNASGWGRFSR